MIDLIIKCLNNNEAISAYEITETRTKSTQLFYVLNKLETNRYTDNRDITVNVYHDHDSFRGSATFMVNSADDEASINEKIADAIKIAKVIENPYFNLAKKEEKELVEIKSIDEDDLSLVATKAMDAIVKADTYENGWINSTEIFVNDTHTAFYNSNDVHLEYSKTSIEIEIIPTWKNLNDEEYELYLDLKSMDADYSKITKEVDNILNQAKYRSIAIPYDESMSVETVSIDGEMLSRALSAFVQDTNYQSVLMKSNHYKINEEICPYDLNIKAKANINGAYNSKPFDNSGIILDEIEIIKNGKVNNYWGSNAFGQYLQIEKPSGSYSVFELEVSEDRQIRELSKPYIELLRFSSPQLDISSGYFGGEVRLALYHKENGEIVPITDFSLIGNIYEAIKTAYYSKDIDTNDYFKGPKVMYLKDFKLH